MERSALALFCLVLAGCEPTAEERFKQAQADDLKCVSCEAKPGDAAYAQCRAQLDAARTGAEATTDAATRIPVVIAPPAAPPPTPSFPRACGSRC